MSDEPSLIALYLQQRGGDRNSWGGIGDAKTREEAKLIFSMSGHYDGQSSHESSYSEEFGQPVIELKHGKQLPQNFN